MRDETLAMSLLQLVTLWRADESELLAIREFQVSTMSRYTA